MSWTPGPEESWPTGVGEAVAWGVIALLVLVIAVAWGTGQWSGVGFAL